MKRGQVRIIAGLWRGRRLQVPDVAGLRPTPDRVRETVFNWLTPKIVGSRCLDAFAGSGVLGFEAASRGAAEVVMTEISPVALRVLTAEREVFAAENIEILRLPQPKALKKITGVFDIVFLDPPWQHQDLLWETFFALVEQKKLAESAWIYLETPALVSENDLPQSMRILKQMRAGDVHSTLVAT